MRGKTICIDFDGVIAEYKKFEGKGIFGEIIQGAKENICKLKDEGWIIIIYTTRSETDLIYEYLINNGISPDYINYNPKNSELGLNLGKPIADIYLDDRAINFDGRWDLTFDKIKNFKRIKQ